ncbi:hypothetical protein JTE90_018015 [Oedothorax gibbosus]|uniref:Large ribosomal subunit protein mL52 n=1 Tax=Oedothorax gibbosus TaxID=931172 RepID=A0AAV6VA30_9ARAC|nr:hypothetical protein JTE90_018015 [Oedothorax gibbosus]
MIICKQMPFLKIAGNFIGNSVKVRNLHISSAVQRNIGAWRKSQGIPTKGKEYGPLTDLPDWSYADGRPAPLSEGQKKRIKLQKQYCDDIIRLSNEVDKCLDLHRQKHANLEGARQDAIRNRLKEKGEVLE